MEALQGRTAVVTGASRGIGLAVARALVTAGVRTWMLARSEAPLATAAGELGPLATALTCDVADTAQVRAAVTSIGAACDGAPDILVNNAGLFPLSYVHDVDIGEFERTVQVNLVAPLHLTRAFLPPMRGRNTGHVVLVGSVADRNVFPGNAMYAATKYGARAMHEVLRMETRGSGVRATLVSPAPTDTAIWDPYDPDNDAGLPSRSQMLRPEAVADAVLWAVSRPAEVNIDELRLSSS